MRRPAFENRVIAEAAVFQDLLRPAEEAAQVLRPVSIGTDRNDLSALLAVAAQDGCGGIDISQAIAKSAGVDLQSDPVFQKQIQDPLKQIRILFITVIPILPGRIADGVVQMAVYIEVREGLQIFDDG